MDGICGYAYALNGTLVTASGADDPGRSWPLGASLSHCSASGAAKVVISAGAPVDRRSS
jgi:hypothetical protein